MRRSIPAGAAGFNGLRVVRNLRNSTLTTQSITVVSGREYQVTIAGANGATCVASNAFTGTLTADGTNRISWPNGTPKTAASTTLTLTITGTLTELLVEDVTGASNQAPSEYVSVGVGTGPELVTNGGFDSGYTGWGIVNTPDIVVSGGVVTITNTGVEYGGLYYECATVVGRAYVLHCDITDVGSGDALVRAYAGAGNYNSTLVQDTKTSAAHVTLYFVATNATSGVRIGLGTNIDGNNATFDNVSIKECNPGNVGADGLAYKAYTNPCEVDENGVVTETAETTPITGGGLHLYTASLTNYADNADDLTSPDTITLGTGTWTLSLEGTAAVTVAAGTAVGSGFGQATEGNSVTFTISTGGTVTLTKDSGALDQSEGKYVYQINAGSAGIDEIPWVPNTGASTTMTAESFSVSGFAADNETRIVVDGADVDVDDFDGAFDATVLGADGFGLVSNYAEYATGDRP